MAGIQHVVVGLDESKLADDAVITALHLSRLFHAPLHALHAIKKERPWFSDPANQAKHEAKFLEAVGKERGRHLFDVLHPFTVTHSEIEEMLRVAFGRPANMLAEHVAETEDALLVLGGHRHRGVFDFGGTSRQILHHLRSPVWVQGKRPWCEPKRILVPVDLTPGSNRVVQMARRLAQEEGAELTFLHCFEPLTYTYGTDFRLEELVDEQRNADRASFESYLKEHAGDVTHRSLFFDGNPDTEILERQADFDLVVMGTHGHGALGTLIVGSHAYRVLSAAEVPVLVVPQPPA